MKKWIIAAAILLTSVTAANAGSLRCGIVQVLPGIFLPQCESIRYEYRSHSRGHHARWEQRRGGRHNHYARHQNHHDRDYYGKKRHPRRNWDIDDRPYHRDSHRW